ncbi:antiterminator LoaP [Clostridiaceae bacterium]|nr:antiterminator LoaP [Clostridiaceae bacterium]
MWYVIQVSGGQEEGTARLMQRRISREILKECFIPRKERNKKFKGIWRQVEEILFPGYVFAVTEEPGELFHQLKSVDRLTKLLREEACFYPLSPEEERMIRGMGDKRHVTRISRIIVSPDAGRDVGREVMILDGPLKNQEGRIVRYNLHKREVTVRMPFMGNEVELRLGIEMVGERGRQVEL